MLPARSPRALILWEDTKNQGRPQMSSPMFPCRWGNASADCWRTQGQALYCKCTWKCVRWSQGTSGWDLGEKTQRVKNFVLLPACPPAHFWHSCCCRGVLCARNWSPGAGTSIPSHLIDRAQSKGQLTQDGGFFAGLLVKGDLNGWLTITHHEHFTFLRKRSQL